MKMFNWFQGNRQQNGGKQNKCSLEGRSSSISYPLPQPEIRDAEHCKWPQGLLAIGTLGGGANPLKEEDEAPRHDPPSASSQASDFTIEEVMELQKKLSKLLNHTPKSIDNVGSRTGKDRFLNCPSSSQLDLDGELDGGMEVGGEAIDDGGHLSPESTVIILRMARELISAAERNQLLGRRKSIALLLKNMFICRGGFSPSPCLRDPILVSTMEKVQVVAD
ncbi:hypothetical protein KSP39_PZI015092 [Platanthera zijinensis]|uniref:Uncharacterized protein n=1 Tax=Platanthera zijinensis TaxID=2320716 RepID=A0AAP0BAG7_9ASPA